MYTFGVDYYPEHWPEERWEVDARLMAEAGFNLVRLAEFAWSRLEPRPGQFDFNWLDRALDILSAQGIRAVLGTPTASPPPWLMTNHPEAYRVGQDGRRATYGNRREYCPNSPVYQEYTRRIVCALAEHYAHHPAVIGWQVDNEFGSRCYCSTCQAAFQEWLKRRYGTLDELNEKWGTIFWSHVYTQWTEIPTPVSTGGSPNPGLALDYARFCSDSYVAYQGLQIGLLRQANPHQFITHNLMGFGYDQINYFDLAAELDLVSWDSYPRLQWSPDPIPDLCVPALGHDTMRGLKRQNFWMMEQQAGPGGWEMIGIPPRPGELRLWAYQAIAHGADAMIFFRWRTARFGTEQYWHGLLDHDATTGRRYAEIKKMGLEIARIGDEILGAEVKAQVAMLLSYDSRFAFQVQPNNAQFSYPAHFLQIYKALNRQHLLVDVVSPLADLHSYRLVIAPAFHVVSAEEADNLRQFVMGGGVLALTQRSGVKDTANRVVNLRLPGLLTELSGCVVEEYDSLSSQMTNAVELRLPGKSTPAVYPVGVLCDILQPTSAEVIGRYTQDYYAGRPAITLNRLGQGKVIYVGAIGSDEYYTDLARWFIQLAGCTPVAGVKAPGEVELAERWQGNKRLVFVLNQSNQPQTVSLDKPVTNLLTGEILRDTYILPAYEVLIFIKE